MEMVTTVNPPKATPSASVSRKFSSRLRASHRWLGLIFGLSVLLSACSGVLHTVMTWTQSPPPRPGAPGPALDVALVKLTPAQAAEAALRLVPGGGGHVSGINVRMIRNTPWYIVQCTGKTGTLSRLYINATNGEAGSDTDAAMAEEIASRFLGGEKVEFSACLTSYDSEYIPIFRILPVYKFILKDNRGTRVYVSTLTESVTRHTDNARQWEADLFSNAHKLAFIPSKMLRDGVLIAMTSGIALAALAGIALFFTRR
ncbi:MAG: PepSY domain-containing protein [Candidatus Methylacidiphilales bacterium]|nr:hypothetical protein [Candidatus Methylacidiphilales bacterium]